MMSNGRMRKLVGILCAMLVLSIFPFTAFAAQPVTAWGDEIIARRFEKVRLIEADLSIPSSGIASCYGRVEPKSTSDTVTLVMELQQYTGGAWKTIKNWSTSGGGTLSLDKIWAVLSGYYYRVVVTAYVYTSSGSLAETVTATTNSVWY